ncbi:hypothetical protein V866_002249 [Kwoniella sp. B9012]
METESKKVKIQNANLRRTNLDLITENKELRSEVEDEENKTIGLQKEDRYKEDKIKKLEDLLQLHHHACVEDIQNLKDDMAHQAEMHRQFIEEEQAKVFKLEEKLKQLEKDKSDLINRVQTTKKQLESQYAEHQSHLKQLTDEKVALEQENEKMLKRCSELEISCDYKDEQTKQITAFLPQAKDLVRGAEQILEGPRNCNTSDSSPFPLDHLGKKVISEVEDATSIQPPGPTSPPIKTNEWENPVDDGFLFHPIQQVAWDNPELTSTDHFTPNLPRFWSTAFEGLESWRNGLYSGEIIQRVLLTSLSVNRLQRHPDLAECFFYLGWSGCNFRAVSDYKYTIGNFDEKNGRIYIGMTRDEPYTHSIVKCEKGDNGRVSDYFRTTVYIT